MEVLVESIDASRRSLRLEFYIYADDCEGVRVLEALLAARSRGVGVRVLVDGMGSVSLPDSFWAPLLEAGGEVRWFNPLSAGRWSYRDHRKLLVCDRSVAVLGGFNIAREYGGDGVAEGWRDLGMRVSGEVCERLEASFDAYFEAAACSGRDRRRLARSLGANDDELLLTHSRKARAALKRSLLRDLRTARDVRLISGYFLPSSGLRRALRRVLRRGGRVQLILAAKSDVAVSQLATRRLYQPLLRAGVEIWEYQPQILHAKLFILDGVVYVGSANLDVRSLLINHELLLRLVDPEVTAGAIRMFQNDLQPCLPIDRARWRRSRGILAKLRERWAYLIMTRLDPWLAGIHLRRR